jgi:hypothetical protein
LKPYYEEDGVTIYHGDCRDVLADLTANVLVTDPPYGFGAYLTDVDVFGPMLAECVERFQATAVFGYPELLVSWCVRAQVIPTEWVTWRMTNPGGARTNGLPRESESIAIFGRTPPGAKRLGRPRVTDSWGRRAAARRGLSVGEARLGDVWDYASPGRGFNSHLRLHPNEKPRDLLVSLLTLCSEAGELILDPFMGSGTTLRAAKDLGRKAIGIEIEERYCEIAARRLSQGVLFGAEAVA